MRVKESRLTSRIGGVEQDTEMDDEPKVVLESQVRRVMSTSGICGILGICTNSKREKIPYRKCIDDMKRLAIQLFA